MAKKPDFTIKTRVWAHNQVFKSGNEAELEKAGYTKARKERDARNGSIFWDKPAPKKAKSKSKSADDTSAKSTKSATSKEE